MEPPLNPDLVVQSLNFHGQQLQKLWESERGEDDLSKVNVNSKEIDFEIYQQRQKQLSFQDRGKRLKLQQFIVKKATSLFEFSLAETSETVKDKTQNDEVSDCYAVMPPYETFIDLDKQSRVRHFLENLQRGDVVFCSIVSKSVSGLMLKVLCSDGEQQRYVSDINVKAFCPMSSMIPAADKKSVTRNYLVNDTVCCEVLEVMPDTEKLVVGMKGFALPPDSEYSCRLGLITSEDFPEMYKKSQDTKGDSYQKALEKSLGFYNPNNINYLANLLGLGSTNYSHMTGMRGRFPEQEYASELRQIQASKWAFRSVAEGIEHFKSGRHSEAFQCLNKALNIDPRNVEGLVARGALYANSGSFQKAIEDFETALKLNPNHQNARKYAGETLVALGRSFEDENKFDEALKAYQNCLTLIPFHEEAQNSIEYLKNKILNSSKLSDSEVTIPGLNSSKSAEVKETLKQLLKSNEEEEKKEKEKSKSKKKKERKSRKRRHRSSSSSSTSSSASSRSSSSSSSSSSESSSASSRSGSHSRSRSPSRSRKSSKKHRKSSKKKEDKRDKSLSPLSKRMALMDPSSEVEGLGGLLAQRVSHYNPPAVPFSFAPFQVQDTNMQKSFEKDDYEQRVCRFLEQTKGDSEYEEKVRKFLEESARWKKERKAQEEKSKKKKKKEKKSRDKEKNKKKKREREEHEKKKKHRSKRSDKFDIKDFEEQMESKKFRDAIRKELTVKDETRKRKSIDDEEEFLYGSGSDKKDLRLLGLENLPDLEDLESKLSAYYAKVEKDTGLSKRSEEKSEKEKKRHSSSPGKNKHASPKVVFVHNEEAKVEEALRAREKKKMDMFADSPSPPANSKEKATPESATVMPSKWKIQIGSTNTRIKKKDKSQIEKEPWDEIEEKRFIFLKDNDKEDSEDEGDVRKKKQPEEKFSARKLRETAEKIVQEKPKKESSEEAREDSVTKTQQFMDKFQSGFRINSSRSSEKKSDELPPLPPGMPPKTSFTISGRGKTTPVLSSSSQAKGPRTDSDTDSNASEKRKKKKPQQQQPQQQQPTPTSQQTPTAASSSAGPGRRLSSGESSRSRSRSRTKYSRASSSNSSRSRSRSYPKNRNRSKSASYDGRRSRSASYARYGSRSRSRSYYRSSASRSRSRSYRSRSRSYDRYSRSRSRSEDYRRRSRSESDDRRRRHDYHMNKFQGRYPRNRGTYYRPRFQNNYKNARGGNNFANRGNRNFHQKYGPGRGNRPFNNRGRGRGRPRFFHYKPSSGYRDYHSRRYEGRPRSRSSDGRRSYSREDDDPMKKVDAAKEKINKYIAEENKKDDAQAASSKSRDEPLSEGEAVDDDDYGLPPLPPGGPPSRESSYVDRKSYEGKWAEKDSEEKGSRSRGSEGPRLPPEEEMDKFLNKVKGQKKDDSKERSKSFGKSSSNW